MKRFLKPTALALAAAVLLAACGSKPAQQPQAQQPQAQQPQAQQPQAQPAQPQPPKAPPVELVVWSNLTDPEIAEIAKVAGEWAKATGNKVQVLANPGGFDEAVTAIQAGKGPDIHYGVPHDNLGKFFKAGQLAPVPDGVIKKEDYQPLSLSAVSFDGKMYAVPVSMEAVGLYYRTDKVKEVPKSLDDLIAAAKKGLGFTYDIKNFYFSYGFIAGMGGYVFKDRGGALDPNDVGLGNEGAQAGYQILRDLVVTHKLMPADVNYDAAKAAFIEGKAAFHINGPWKADNFKKAGVPFAVAPVPSLPGGKPFVPFVGVQAAFVNAKIPAEKQKAAWELVKELQARLPLALFKSGNRIPVQKALLEHPEVKANANLFAFAQSAAAGVPMPNIAAMGAVWGPAGAALDLLVQGKLEPRAAAEKIVKEVREGIAQQK